MNAWLAWTQAAAHLCFSIGAGLMSGMAQLTRPTPPATQPALQWPDEQPIWLPATELDFELRIKEFTWDPRWDGVLRQEP